jgi:NDP-sugar pyrophosphorylase family protein
MKAMIFAAGFGTRLRPLTNNIPKALVKVGNTTLLELAIANLKKFNINEIIINVHHFGDQIINFLNENNFGVDIQVSDERELLLDTGGGLKKCAEYFAGTDPFLLYNVDIISDIDINEMLKYHNTSNSLATLAVRNRDTSRYLLFDENNVLSGWKNIKTGEILNSRINQGILNSFAFSGIHIINPEIFDLMPGENIFSIIKLYLKLSIDHTICGYNHTKSEWLDVGKLDSIEDAESLISKMNINY